MPKPILKKATSIFEEEAPKKKVDPKKAVKVLESSIKSLKTARMSLVGIKSKLKEEDGENPNEAVDALADTIDSIESAISDIIDATSATNPAVQTLIGTVDTLEAEKDNAEIDAMLSGEGDEFTEETEDEEKEDEEDEDEEEMTEETEEDDKEDEDEKDEDEEMKEFFSKKTVKESSKNEIVFDGKNLKQIKTFLSKFPSIKIESGSNGKVVINSKKEDDLTLLKDDTIVIEGNKVYVKKPSYGGNKKTYL